MKKIEIKIGVLIDATNHAPGDVVEVDDERARQLVRHGAAILRDGPAVAVAADSDAPPPDDAPRPRSRRPKGEPAATPDETPTEVQ